MFDFPTRVDSLDAVPEPYRALYAEGEDGHGLDEALARKLDVSGLTSALDKERKSGREAERALKEWQALGRSPSEIADLVGLHEKTLTHEAERKGEWEKLKGQLAARHRAELASRDERIGRLRAAVEKQLVDAAAGAEIAGQSGVPALLLPHIRERLRVSEDADGGFALSVVDADGAPRLDAQGRPFTLADLVAEMRQSEIFGRAFTGSGVTGGGMPPNAAGGGMPGGFALTRDQAKDPAAYRRVREQAARAGQLLTIVE